MKTLFGIRVLRAGLLLVLAALLAWPMSGMVPSQVEAADERSRAAEDRHPQRVILRLQGAPVAVASSVRGEALWHAPAAIAAEEALARAQDAMLAELKAAVPEAQVEHSYRLALNGLAVRLPSADEDFIARLAALPGVEGVYPDLAYRPALYAAHQTADAAPVWAALGGQAQAGAGMRIAIIDAGLHTDHPMLDPTGLDYPPGGPLGDPRATTAKVIAARTYLRADDPPLPGEEHPIPGALGSAHGTYLAGVAAGAPVSATYRGLTLPISGVAPGAWLMSYRVFYPSRSGLDVAYASEILAAVEDALRDGADVILAGWAGSPGLLPAGSPVAAAMAAAVQAGCVVVAAAGNEGPAAGSASVEPGGAPEVLAVGASTTAERVAWDQIDVLGPEPVVADLLRQSFARALFGPRVEVVAGPRRFAPLTELLPEVDPLACEPLPAGALSGLVVLVDRGGCPFADKTYHLQQAGAAAAIVINDAEAITELACAGVYCASGAITIPTVMVAQSHGARLAAWATIYPTATLHFVTEARVVPNVEDQVPSFSARGPASMQFLKPDLVAPGDAVLSAWIDDAGAPVYDQRSGSSVAAAYAAGAAALARQLWPDWGPAEVRSALANRAQGGLSVWTGTAAPAAGALARGAGRLDLPRLLEPGLLFWPTTLAIPQAKAGQTQSLQLAVRDARTDGEAATYAVRLVGANHLSSPGAPAALTLAPGEELTLSVAIAVSAGAPQGDHQADLVVEGPGESYRVPLWVHVSRGVSGAAVLVIDNDFSQFEAFPDYAGYVTDALGEAGVSFDYWDADLRFGNPQTIPDLEVLQRYAAVIWFTGDNVNPPGFFAIATPLTPLDQRILMRYLDAGGRLLAIGQNLAEASDVNPSPDPTWERSELYHAYLGAHRLQPSLFGPAGADQLPPAGEVSVVGVPGRWLQGVRLDLGGEGDGAANQVAVDEIGPGGRPDLADAPYVTPLLAAAAGVPVGQGLVGLAKACGPSLARSEPACAYRTAYLSFGLEGINERPGLTTRADLLDRVLTWFRAEVDVWVADQTAAPHEPTQLVAEARSSVGAAITAYIWRLGEGEGARTLVTTGPLATVILEEAGTLPLRVMATDALGHTAVADATVQVLAGGASTFTASRASAVAGEEIVYRAVARHTGEGTLAVRVELPLPEHTAYVSHAGGDRLDDIIVWEGLLGPFEQQVVELRVQVLASAPAGEHLVAGARFQAGAGEFTRLAQTWIGRILQLPLIFHGFVAT